MYFRLFVGLCLADLGLILLHIHEEDTYEEHGTDDQAKPREVEGDTLDNAVGHLSLRSRITDCSQNLSGQR